MSKKIKNPFKKQSIVDTLTNTAIGGAGNVVFDYAWDAAGLDKTFAGEDGKGDVSTIKNAIKLVGGAIAGSMVSNKYVRAMTDGFAVVGASNLVSGLITPKETTGLPEGTIGKIRRYGNPEYAQRMRAARGTRGTQGTNGLEGFMG